MPEDLPPLVVVAGATASGKTALALAVAEGLAARGIPAEIISADSRQVYRGMDIGTAKVTAEERARVQHHGRRETGQGQLGQAAVGWPP